MRTNFQVFPFTHFLIFLLQWLTFHWACFQFNPFWEVRIMEQCFSQKILLKGHSGPWRLVLGANFLGKGPLDNGKKSRQMQISCHQIQVWSSSVKAPCMSKEQYLRNRKHVPCFYWVIQTRVEVWENEKCCGNTSRRRVFPQLFRVLPNFHQCLYNSIETQSTCFLFLLENNARRKRKTC